MDISKKKVEKNREWSANTQKALVRPAPKSKKRSFCNKFSAKACSINKRFTNPMLKQISQVTR